MLSRLLAQVGRMKPWLLGRLSADSQSQKTYCQLGMGPVRSLEFLPSDSNWEPPKVPPGQRCSFGQPHLPGDSWDQYLGVQYQGP